MSPVKFGCSAALMGLGGGYIAKQATDFVISNFGDKSPLFVTKNKERIEKIAFIFGAIIGVGIAFVVNSEMKNLRRSLEKETYLKDRLANEIQEFLKELGFLTDDGYGKFIPTPLIQFPHITLDDLSRLGVDIKDIVWIAG